MQSFEFEVEVHCRLELVFSIYTDLDRWRNRSIFADIRWVKGIPWEEGSRLLVETRVPFHNKVDQVVLHCTANDSVSYLSHVLGITTETRITFRRISEGQTVIWVRMQMVGKVSRALGFAIEPVILKATKRYFEDLRRECEAAGKDSGTNS
jgi:hypothetical protein